MPRALVTGAARGIGRAVAEALRDAGYEVIGTSRDPAGITDPPSGVRFLPLDLANADSIAACADQAGQLDLLVNNAGFSQAGPLCETPWPEIEDLITTNWTGVIRLTRAVMPGMAQGGRIITVGSLAGRIPLPYVAVYAGLKGGLESFTKALRLELAPLGGTACIVEPGFVKTDIRQDLFVDPASPHAERVARVRAFRAESMARAAGPEEVAAAVLKAAQSPNPKAVWVAGRGARLFNVLSRVLPAGMFERAYRRKLGI